MAGIPENDGTGTGEDELTAPEFDKDLRQINQLEIPETEINWR